MHILPGDPIRVLYGEKVPEEFIQEVRDELGLNLPISQQYVRYISRFIRGDLGVSLKYRRPVIEKIKEVYPVTLELALGGLFLASVIGIPLGIISALKRGSRIDNVIRGLTLYIYSNPSFWIALLFQLTFGLWLGVFPISGHTPPGFTVKQVTRMLVVDSIIALNPKGLLQSLRHLFLPWMTIGLSGVPFLTRVTRASLIDVIGEDYITTARAKGVQERRIVYVHAMRNALLPIITIIGGSLTWMLGGSVITEQIFAFPGLGGLLMTALQGRDFDMIQGIVSIYAVIVIASNTLVDIIYAAADPRVKF
jgi:ABC-type dipeptide/oligopeptide/nickel transport system permease component